MTLEEQIHSDTMQSLLKSYDKMCREGRNKFVPPEIDQLYMCFRDQWIDDMHNHVTTNADAYVVNPLDFQKGDVEKVLANVGFLVPSLTRFHAALNSMGMSYISNNKQIINEAVVEIW
jgi:hypothetical protein